MNLRIRRNTTYFIQHCNHTQVVYNWKGDKLQGWYATNVTDSGVTHRVGMSGESGPMAASLSSLHIHPYVHTTDIKSNSA